MNLELLELNPPPPSRRYSAKLLLHQVDFFLHAPQAQLVCLIGDFNEWQPETYPMTRMPDGGWMIRLLLSHGHHQYLFLVDGEPLLDPNATGTVTNERGETVSLVAVS
jgi:1,4-alpha-glucan branching enzyme